MTQVPDMPEMEAPAPASQPEPEVVSPEMVWRVLRSGFHPLLAPVRYFRWVAEAPGRYLKPMQALALGLVGLWIMDGRFEEMFSTALKVPVSSLAGAQKKLFDLFRATVPVMVVWGGPFFTKLGAAALRIPMDWKVATRLAAYLAPYAVLGAVAELVAGQPGLLVTTLWSAVAAVIGLRETCKASTLRAVGATAVSTVVQMLIFATWTTASLLLIRAAG